MISYDKKDLWPMVKAEAVVLGIVLIIMVVLAWI